MKPYHVHLTDLFHPHGDPDDHYDLALAFALDKLGFTELGAVIMDYPPPHRVGDPALCAVAQLNAITGRTIPAITAAKDTAAAGQQILTVLQNAPRPVSFSVVGTTENIAAAIKQNPQLFAEKCAGIYLAAGSGIQTEGGPLEYNVRLHPEAYSRMFSAPCPLYWAPCYHTILPGDRGECGGEYGSVFCILQKEILDGLTPAMQNYFLYMLTRSADPKYLRYLDAPVDTAALAEHREKVRRLWSAPLLLRIAGIPCDSFSFDPIRAVSASDGTLNWEAAETSAQFIFHMKQNDRSTADSFDRTGRYKEEMVKKLTELLSRL